MSQPSDILKSWEANAENWIQTIQNDELESRRLVTNDAIVTTVLGFAPRKILDLGCGEGWLTRTLRSKGAEVFGTDAVRSLVDEAINKDGQYYFQYSYEDIIAGRHSLPAPFDAIVINFALLDKEVTEDLTKTLPSLLAQNGHVFIQTLHPMVVATADVYQSGWRDGSWNGMKREFILPYQWYFRTLEDWVSLFKSAGLQLDLLREPVHPQTGKTLSVIFVLRACKQLND